MALGSAVCVTIYVRPLATGDVSTELIAFFSIQSAIILPAMILTAGLLRGDGLSVDEANRYQVALRQQMYFWVNLLILDFLAVVLLIGGKAIGWEIILPIWRMAKPISLNPYLFGITGFVVSLCVFRVIPFVRGVISLLDLNGDLVRKSIEERERQQKVALMPPMQEVPFAAPDNYGQIIPH